MSRGVPSGLLRPVEGTRSGALLWRACLLGKEPAESLDTRDREDLVAELMAQAWSLPEIAALTRMSTYTTARIAARVAARLPERVAA